MQKTFFIPLNTPSSKNSKRWTGKMLISSKQVMNYKKNTCIFWVKNQKPFLEATKDLEKPLKVGFYFIRNSKRKFDYVNVAQLPLDLMQEYGWIEDDCMNEIIPYFLGYEIDKNNPGLKIVLDI
jgi:Holliday junction resolvase RusA-like endonuclease